MLPKDTESKSFDHAIAGAVSGFGTRFLFQPLDVVKIRFQLQVEPITSHHVSKYQSVSQAFVLICKEEGVSALWKGHIPAQVLSIIYGMTQFYSYDIIKEYCLTHIEHTEWKHPVEFFAGAAAGSIATVLSFPFDTMRTRLVAQSMNHQVYNGIYDCCSAIVRHESPKALYKGLLPTLMQVYPHAGIQFACYGICTDMYRKYVHQENTSFINSMIAGSVAGLIAKTAVYPFDLARKRLQIQGFEHGRKGFGKFFKCRGLWSCIQVTIKEEGSASLFKGLVPSQLKAVLTTALHFTIYEQALILLKFLH